jgi:hypothetical protein
MKDLETMIPNCAIAQLQFALLRTVRFVAAIRIHGKGSMADEDTVKFFTKEAYLSPDNARREAWRVATDPRVTSYTAGKFEIRRLRDDYKKEKGGAFSLKDFHDNLLKHGYPPLKVMRAILLKSETPSRGRSYEGGVQGRGFVSASILLYVLFGLSGLCVAPSQSPDDLYPERLLPVRGNTGLNRPGNTGPAVSRFCQKPTGFAAPRRCGHRLY